MNLRAQAVSAGSPRVGKTGSKARTPLPAGSGTMHPSRTDKSTALQWQHQHLPEKVNIFLLSALGRFLLTWFNWVLALVKALERDNLCLVTEELRALTMVTSLFAQSTYEPILSSLSAVWPGSIQESILPFLLLFCSIHSIVRPKVPLLSTANSGWDGRVVSPTGGTGKLLVLKKLPGSACPPSSLTGVRTLAWPETSHPLPSTPPHL